MSNNKSIWEKLVDPSKTEAVRADEIMASLINITPPTSIQKATMLDEVRQNVINEKRGFFPPVYAPLKLTRIEASFKKQLGIPELLSFSSGKDKYDVNEWGVMMRREILKHLPEKIDILIHQSSRINSRYLGAIVSEANFSFMKEIEHVNKKTLKKDYTYENVFEPKPAPQIAWSNIRYEWDYTHPNLHTFRKIGANMIRIVIAPTTEEAFGILFRKLQDPSINEPAFVNVPQFKIYIEGSKHANIEKMESKMYNVLKLASVSVPTHPVAEYILDILKDKKTRQCTYTGVYGVKEPNPDADKKPEELIEKMVEEKMKSIGDQLLGGMTPKVVSESSNETDTEVEKPKTAPKKESSVVVIPTAPEGHRALDKEIRKAVQQVLDENENLGFDLMSATENPKLGMQCISLSHETGSYGILYMMGSYYFQDSISMAPSIFKVQPKDMAQAVQVLFKIIKDKNKIRKPKSK